jgi:hypothetical protein
MSRESWFEFMVGSQHAQAKKSPETTTCSELIVILQPQVRNRVFSSHPSQGVLELHELDENVMLRVDFGSVHGRFEVERKPFLNASHAGALRRENLDGTT